MSLVDVFAIQCLSAFFVWTAGCWYDDEEQQHEEQHQNKAKLTVFKTVV
jgi:hypothetical protein